MVEATATTVLAASPDRVWEILIGFDNYASWHPYLRLSGAAVPGARIDFTFQGKPNRRGLTSDAMVVEVDKPSALAIEFAMGGLFNLRDRYILTPNGAGTTVIHSVRCDGLMATVFAYFGLRKRLQRLAEYPNIALTGRCTKAGQHQAKTVKRPLAQPARGFRQPPKRPKR